MYHGNTLDWQLGGLGSGPHYPPDLEEVTYSGYASVSSPANVASAQNQAFKTRHASAAS